MTLFHRTVLTSAILCLGALVCAAAPVKDKDYSLTSPDGSNIIVITIGEKLSYSVSHAGIPIVRPSEISMTLGDGTVYGGGEKVKKVVKRSVDQTLSTVIYHKSQVRDAFNEMTFQFKRYSLVVRAYDDGVAYRFVGEEKSDFTVKEEKATFAFAKDWQAYVPYVLPRDTFERQYYNSFENVYEHHSISAWEKGRLAFLPITIEADSGVKLCVTESDLLDYPGMYLWNTDASSTLRGNYAPYPKDIKQGGHNMLQGEVQTREDFIAKGSGRTSFPWRTIIIAEKDTDLLASDMVWKLATTSTGDFSWVKPGKVAWDWWNDWNLYGVDFRAGINNDTYKYYIDFASANGIEYVILDEGWAVNLKADLLQVVPAIDLPMLASYAKSKNVGLILWAGYWAFDRDMENVCRIYSDMGIKGFKVDFMDRDDQIVVDFYRRSAETAAKYHMLVDFHGAYKPTGLHRTFPNVINFEGVHGLEQLKWGRDDQVTYDVTIPYTRMVAGPMDYTQGAMRNASKDNYRPVNSEAMSQGTRCHQLAEYVVFDSPLNMLCDSPSNYLAEMECTTFIAEVPTTWDETLPLCGEIAKYVSVARRKGSTWYVAALGGWDPRDLELDLGFLGEGNWTMTVFKDGVNADRAARDYKREILPVPVGGKVSLHMAPGGGWVAKIEKK